MKINTSKLWNEWKHLKQFREWLMKIHSLKEECCGLDEKIDGFKCE